MDKYLKSKMKLGNNYKEGDYDAYRKNISFKNILKDKVILLTGAGGSKSLSFERKGFTVVEWGGIEVK
ncbi:hypothetical protein [Clostridium sp. UBA7503]|uniref:hypothetical protein n=1 Tax=Clostridium sp. UBA7503 TaxID=1946377 RepID=UPI003217471C